MSRLPFKFKFLFEYNVRLKSTTDEGKYKQISVP